MEKELKEKILEDYKSAVGECLYFASISSLRDDKIEKIMEIYKLKSFDNYEDIINQLKDYNIEDLQNILDILDIEADDEWTNANRCEARAITLGKYL